MRRPIYGSIILTFLSVALSAWTEHKGKEGNGHYADCTGTCCEDSANSSLLDRSDFSSLHLGLRGRHE